MVSDGSDARAAGRNSRANEFLFVSELGALVALTLADLRGWVPLSRTPFVLLLAWVSPRLRGLAWRHVGLARPRNLRRAIGIGVAAGLAIELFALAVTTPLITAVTGAPPDVSELKDVVGNLPILLVVLAASWLLAAFGEELAFRGYLMNRVADGLGRTRPAWILSLLLVSVFFGIGHGTQGAAGIVQESLSGAWLGLAFLASRCNLTVPIVAHGMSNTLALVLIYLNRYPGLP